MARSESLEKGGYYAFPEDELINLAKLFRPSTSPLKILDPCAGEGVALETLAKAWNATPYAVELEYHRAEKCINKFGDTAIFGDFFNTDISSKAFGVVYCNPPFTSDSTSPFKRREIDMLNKTWKHVAEGGYMVFVSYNHHLNMQASMEIASRCKQWWLYRLPARHFGEYCFTILVGQVGKPTNKLESANELTMLAKNVDSIPLLEEATPLQLPVVNTKGFYFRVMHSWTTGDRLSYANNMIRILGKYGAERNAQFKTTYETNALKAQPIRPVVRPKTGHLVTLIAGGMLDYLPLTTSDGNRAMLRSTVKYVEELVKTEEEPDNTKETYHLRPAVTITLLHETGRLQKFVTDEDITFFIQTYKEQLFKYVEDKFTPRYQILGDSPEKRKWLPHMKRQRVKGKFELFPAQQHVASAVCTTLDQLGKALLIGEMSTGKTPSTLAVIDAWHKEGKVKPSQIVLVTCPSHLVYKWKREAELQLPHAHVTTLVLEDKTGRHDMLAEFAQAMRNADKNPNALHIVIASQDSIKLGEGWSPAYNVRKTYTKEIRKREETFICATTGDDLKDIRDAIQLSKTQKGRKALNKRGREQWYSLWQETRKIGLPKGNNGRVKVLPNGELKALTSEPILDKWIAQKGIRATSNPRAPLWRLIKSQYKGRIALFVIDETHQSQNIASDRYRSMSNIARCSDAILGLTGTIFNGYASSLYGLETLFNPKLFERYEWGNAGLSAFARDMGVLEKVIENRRDYASGHWSGTKRIVHAVKEIPGASPLLIQMVLDHAVFLSLKDIGKSLPILKETPVGIDMSDTLSTSYKEGERILKNHWDATRQDGDSSFLASYFISRLAYPDTAFEAMQVNHTRLIRDEHGRILDKTTQLVHTFPMVEDLPLPKEQWLIDTVKTEIAQGRGVGIFVLQTDKRDMQPRIAVLLEELAGAKTVILTRDVKGVDREEYIEKAFEQGANVLICNPRLVETGLDIVQCPTLIFIAPEYQLSVLAQASRRHWRIPQTKDCKTFYLYYKDTIQEQAMGLITKKLSSLSVLNGDSASVSALSQIGDILEELLDANISFKNLSDEFAIINNRTFDDSEWVEADHNEPPKPTPINTDATGLSVIEAIKASLQRPKQLSLI